MNESMTHRHRTSRRLQQATIAWNLAEVGVTVGLGISAGSLALVAFGLDSLIEVFASAVVLWHMGDTVGAIMRDRRAQRLLAGAFAVLAICLVVASVWALVSHAKPDSSPLGIAYLAITAIVMFTLAAWKRRIGRALNSAPLLAEARMTFLDGWLATVILVALGVNTLWGWSSADALGGLIVSFAATRESVDLLR